MMTPERWEHVKGVLAAAIELPAEERTPERLSVLCEGDARLVAEIEGLLAAHDAAVEADFDAHSLRVPPLAAEGDEVRLPAIGQRLGPYRIDVEIARGGMGAVYGATRADDEFRKQVAVKIVDRAFPSPRSLEMFRHERQILAGLEHPNIARLIDGGTTRDGAPYLVMEYVEGERIDRYCEARSLSVEGRLRLFLRVCAAVHYAHQHLVVHRDIKPANILVTAEGEPKLLDFGIAKILSPPGDGEYRTLTASGPWALTPAYASPEQLRGEPITTATDVYSLGLVLYELLSRRHPYDFGTRLPHEVARIILDTQPEPPSAAVRRPRQVTNDEGASDETAPAALKPAEAERLHRRLAGDLDTIVLKAIRKDPRERYASVEQFAQDIRRHLEGRPIAARNQTLRYRATKFVERHTLAVIVGAVVLATLSAAVVMTVRSAAIARSEQILADRRFAQLRELARSNLFELHDAIAQLSGSAPARNLLIQRSLRYLDGLNAEAGGNRDLEADIATGYERIAKLQGNFSGPGIGDSRAELASYGKAVAIREALVADRPGDLKSLTSLARSLTGYVIMLQELGRTAQASKAARGALDLAERIARIRPSDPRSLADEALAQERVALVEGGNGSSASIREIGSAIDHDRRAVAIFARLAAGGRDAAIEVQFVYAQLRLAYHLQKQRAFAEASRVFDEILASDAARHLPPMLLSFVHNYRGNAFERAGDQQRALDDYQVALRLVRLAADAEPADLEARINVAIEQGHVGMQTARLGRPRAGLPQLDEAIHIGERLLAANSTQLFYKNLLVIGYSYHAEILSMLGDQAGAETKYGAALRLATDLSHADREDLESPLSIAKIHAALGVVLARADRYADARRELDAARDGIDRLLRERPEDVEGTYVARMIRDDTAALARCSDGQPCSGARLLPLPMMMN